MFKFAKSVRSLSSIQPWYGTRDVTVQKSSIKTDCIKANIANCLLNSMKKVKFQVWFYGQFSIGCGSSNSCPCARVILTATIGRSNGFSVGIFSNS